MKAMKPKLCPVCGESTHESGNITTDGRIILKCGDAVFLLVDRLFRRYWKLRSSKRTLP